MTTTVKQFVAPESVVRFSNIKVDVKNWTFEVTLGTKTKKQKLFREEVVTGKVSRELYKWLTEAFKERIKVEDQSEQGYYYAETGNLLTGFKSYLAKKNIEFKPGILNQLVFESDNKSDSYADNPFKLIKYADGKASLTLVNVGVKKAIIEEDPNTGESKSYWKQTFVKMGDRITPQFFNKKHYIRLRIEQFIEVTQYQPQTANA